MVDSGADDNFIDKGFVLSAKIPLELYDNAKPMSAIDGSSLETVSNQTGTLTLTIPGNHHERIRFLFISSTSLPVVFGLPWLKLHDPHIDWVSSSIVSWSTFCHPLCLRSASPVTHPSSSAFTPRSDLKAL